MNLCMVAGCVSEGFSISVTTPRMIKNIWIILYIELLYEACQRSKILCKDRTAMIFRKSIGKTSSFPGNSSGVFACGVYAGFIDDQGCVVND